MNIKQSLAFLIVTIMLICSGCSPENLNTDSVSHTVIPTDDTESSPYSFEELQRTKYNMDVTLHDEEKPYLSMTAQITFKNDSSDVWNEICFRDFMRSNNALDMVLDDEAESPHDELNGIKSAKLPGEELNVRTDDEDRSICFVELNTPLSPGEVIELTLEYSTRILKGCARCAYQTIDKNDTSGENLTYELAQFYPILPVYENGEWADDENSWDYEAVYTKCADYEIVLHLPEKYDVIASGEESREETSDGISTWRIFADNMRDVTIIASNELTSVSAEACGVKINSYHHVNHTRQGEISLQNAVDSVNAFTEAYGAYPYDELDVVESNFGPGALEAPGLVRIGPIYSYELRDIISKAQQKQQFEHCAGAIAHEIAHEWFYAAIGNDQYNEPWLDESFASFSEQVYWRYMGRDEKEIAKTMDIYRADINGKDCVAIDRAVNEFIGMTYQTTIYNNGAAFLYDLEQSMGQETFYDFMREYYAEYSLKEAHTEDFLRIITPYVEDNTDAQELLLTYLERASDFFKTA